MKTGLKEKIKNIPSKPGVYQFKNNSGEIIYNNIDILKSKQKEIQKIRGNNISAIFQEPMTSLNPLHTIEKQVNEILMTHSSISYSDASKKTKKLLDQVGLNNISNRIKAYPYELSGGQRRLLSLGRAIAMKPKLLLLDEPGAGLSPVNLDNLMHTILSLKEKYELTVVVVEHILKVVMNTCERITVLDHGQKIAEGSPEEVQNDHAVIEAYLVGKWPMRTSVKSSVLKRFNISTSNPVS